MTLKLTSILFFGLLLCSFIVNAEVTITESVSLGNKCTSPLTPSYPSTFWIEGIKHDGIAATNPNPSTYPVYRNVKDYGAKGDGVTDDTAAINSAISNGGRCGEGCGSSTRSPAIVYFPQGTYIISSPIIGYYYTQIVGDAVNPPTLKAASSFSGVAVIDVDPYDSSGNNWFINQDNFYRQVRNFVIDLTDVSGGVFGIHWQVAQATSLTNIHFRMSTTPGNTQRGVYMEDGSANFFSDLVFHGGQYGMWIANQQFTSRNISIRKASTAIFVDWDWGWTFKDINISDCNVGLDISAGGSSKQNVGSAILLDSLITDTPVGVLTARTSGSQPLTAGSLIIDNLDVSNVNNIVQGVDGSAILAGPGSGSTVINSWGQGRMYMDDSGKGNLYQGDLTAPEKSSVLLDSTGKFFSRPRPQYESYDVSDFVSVKDQGAAGDGKTDDTAAIQQTLQDYAGCKIIFFPAGVYVITSTVLVPAGSRIVGEVWSVIAASGSNFQNPKSPQAVFKVGNSGDSGVAELSDLLFSVANSVPGAILVEWNIHDPEGQQGVAGMWDVHFRIGGARGTNLGQDQCPINSGVPTFCEGTFASMHLTSTSSAYLENVWAWNADHDLDGDHPQLSIYNARGILIESANGPVWLYGTASEHSVMYQYNIVNAKNVILAMIQTETPYFQSSPKAPLPFVANSTYNDPTFAHCSPGSQTCAMAWALRIMNSQNIYLYGAGLYNFFQNYDQTCLQTQSCQDALVSVEGDTSSLYIYNLNTVGATWMVSVNGTGMANQDHNTNTFCSTITAIYAFTGQSSSESAVNDDLFLAFI